MYSWIIFAVTVILLFLWFNRTKKYEGYYYSSGPIHRLKQEPTLWPTQGLNKPVFGYVYGHGKQVPGYGTEGVLTVHPSVYEIQKQYAESQKLVSELDSKIDKGQPMTIPESFKYANAQHMLNKLQGYFQPYFY